jgi:uncharacterized membrane protein YcaP (DUF421 family)
MNRKRLTMSLVALLVVSLFIAAFQIPPQHDRSLHQFVGTETCKIIDQGKVLDKETIQKNHEHEDGLRR